MPVMIETLSFSISFCASCVATSGLNWSSFFRISTGTPPSLPPACSTPSMKPSYMSWPSGPMGPEKVVR